MKLITDELEDYEKQYCCCHEHQFLGLDFFYFSVYCLEIIIETEI